MADESLSWELGDKVNGPIGELEDSLERLSRYLATAKVSMTGFESSVTKAALTAGRVDWADIMSHDAYMIGSSRVRIRRPMSDPGDAESAKRFEAFFSGGLDPFTSDEVKSLVAAFSGNRGKGARDATSISHKIKSTIATKLFGKADKETISKVESGFSKIVSAGAAAAKSITSVAIAMTESAAQLAAAGAKWTLKRLVFQEDSMATFETKLGSQAAASRVFKQATAFAAETPLSSEEAISGFQRFLTAGFKEDQLDMLMRAAGDVGAAMGTDKMQSVIAVMERVRAKGMLQSEELMQLAEAGIGPTGIKEALQGSLGKSETQIEKLMQNGKITGEQGIEAILEAIRVSLSGGKLGGGMSRKSKTLGSLFSSMMDIPSILLFSSNALKATEPIKNLIAGISKAFEKGQPLFERGTAMFDRVARAWGGAFGVIDQAAVDESLGRAIDLIGDLMVNAGVFVGGFLDTMTTNMSELFGDDHDATDRMLAMGDAVAKLVTMILWAGEKAMKFVGWAQDIGLVLWENPSKGQFEARQRKLAKLASYRNDADDIWGRLANAVAKERNRRTDEKGWDFQAWLGMPKVDSSKLAPPDGRSKAANVTTTIGDIHVNVQPGQDVGIVEVIAANIRKSLPTQISNLALEQGG